MSRKFSNAAVVWKNNAVSSGSDNPRSEDFLRKVNTSNDSTGRITKKKGKGRPQDCLGLELDADMEHALVPRGSGSVHYVQGGSSDRGTHRNQNNQGLNRSYWYQVTVVNGSRYTRAEILSKLEEAAAPTKFHPICYQIIKNDSIFYVERLNNAQLLLSCSKKVVLSDGKTLALCIKDSRPPVSQLDYVVTAKIKEVMANRFVMENKALDLSEFVRDPGFRDGMFCSLNRSPIFAAVLNIIVANIPDLVALNLSGNGLRTFDNHINELKKLKSLRILHLNNNNIPNLNALNCMKELQITELMVDNNPVHHSFPDRTHFIRYEDTVVTEVRKRFPKLTKLDNRDLIPVAIFDVGDDAVLPPPQAAFICAAEGRSFVKEFLSQYFQIYDSNDRLDLTQAYADNALFSFTSAYPANSPIDAPRLNSYLSGSRNLLRITDFPRRKVRMDIGKEKIVNFLYKNLPKTEHDLLSFAVDLPIFTPQLISLGVTGVFRERGIGLPTNWPLRHFSRTFMIVPMGSGFCIVNETLFVTNASAEQAEVAFKGEPEKPIPTSPTLANTLAIPAPVPVIDDAIKLQMVQSLSEQSGMNLDWSKKCLEETEWDFNRANFTFGELQKQGAIPAEAFIK